MATITQMTSAARSIYTSLYTSNSRTDATTALFGGNQTRRRPSSSYYSTQYRGAESSAKELRSIMDIANQAASLRKSYAETSSKFYAEYDSNMKDLRKSAGKVSGMDYQLSGSDITTNADGSKSYSDRLKTAIGNVKDLVGKQEPWQGRPSAQHRVLRHHIQGGLIREDGHHRRRQNRQDEREREPSCTRPHRVPGSV